MILSNFSERLSELLFENELTPPTLAAQVGCQRLAIYRYLNGSQPSIEMAVRLADFFHCTVDFLIGAVPEDHTAIFITPPPFSEWFPILLDEFKVSRYRLQKLTGISDTIMRNWWNGVKVPSLDSVIKIADALGCSIDHVIGRSN